MKTLKIIKDSDTDPDKQDVIFDFHKEREAARVIVFDRDNKLALLYVAKYKYHKLPGGGIEHGESIKEALVRECKEEIGCEICIKDNVGLIEEYRGKYNLHQKSYCFTADLVGQKGQPDFTQDEVAAGFEIIWVTLSEAINKISTDTSDNYEGGFIRIRDLAFLQQLFDLQNKKPI